MLEINFNPFPELSTERLTLRQFTNEDVHELFVLRSDKKVMQFIPRPLAKTTDDILQLIQKVNEMISKNEGINWAVTLKNDSKVIGMIGYFRMAKEHYRAEVGYMLHPAYQGKGIMREALNTVIDYGFSVMKLHSMEAIVDPQNLPSAKLLERYGFTKAGFFKEHEFFDGKFFDSFYYTLLTPVK
ncbi:MAG: GNAT family N-acetyltransferase [Bacteroidia bacterium]